MNSYKPNEYEQEIDLIELFWTLIMRWKLIVVMAVIGAIIVGAGKFAKDSMDYKRASESHANMVKVKEESDGAVAVYDENGALLSNDKIDELIDGLSAYDTAAVENLIARGEQNIERLSSLDNSLIMKINGQKVKTLTMCYVVNSEDNEASITAAEVYRDAVSSPELATIIAGTCSYDESSIYELMCDSASILGLGYSVKESSAVKFAMFLTDDMDEGKVIEAVNSLIDEKMKSLSTVIPNKCVLINSSADVSYNDALLRFQNVETSQSFEEYTMLRDKVAALSIAQKALFAKRLEEYPACKEAYAEFAAASFDSQGKITTKASGEETIAAPAAPSISAKFILIGCVVGAFLACAFVGCMYIFSVKLSSAEIMAERFGSVIFGKVGARSVKERNKCKRSIEEQVRTTAIGIALCCKQKGIDRVAFIGTDVEHLNQEYVNMIEDAVATEDVTVVRLGNIFYDAKALIECANIGSAVVFEGVGISIYNEIENEIIKANEYGIDLLGSVIL